MALEKYKEKRDFKETPEPGPKVKKSSGALRFTVQRHDASHLHYDLRLEVGGVLKSWAVPKGPSMNPEDKRMAVETEDHPYEYLSFNGVIPEGEYGGGIMDVWDTGTYTVPGIKERKEVESKVKGGYYKGHIEIEFKGKKLKGVFDLIFTEEKEGRKLWRLIKREDKYATIKPYTAEDYPPITDVWKKNKKGPKKKTAKPKIKVLLPKGAKPIAFPDRIAPMKAKLIKKAFTNESWLFELKWDGYRALANVKDGKVDLYSKGGLDFEYYTEVIKALEKLPFEAVLDGEIVAYDEKGEISFHRLQTFKRHKYVPLTYYVFDILYFQGHNLMRVPLLERKNLLEELLPASDVLKYSQHFLEVGEQIFEFAKKHNLEGIVGKHKRSIYEPGKRSPDWVKIKTHSSQEGVIVGYTKPKKKTHFGGLILAVQDKGRLRFIGSSGGGFSEAEENKVYKLIAPHKIDKNPLPEPPKGITDPVQWVEPKYVCEVEFSEWTPDMLMRHPVYKGLRPDKKPSEVVFEIPKDL
jgi:bifunctional non-homologous end joining protein LigD